MTLPPLPAGWALHPQNPQYMYEVANPANVQPLPAAAPTPQPVAAPSNGGAAEYGTLDVDYAAQQYDALKNFSRDRGEELWLDFDKVTRVGEESSLLVRLLPPWAKGEREANVLQVRHRLFAEYWPGDTGKRQIMWPVCHNQQHGPGDCPIDQLIEDAATSAVPGFAEHVDNFKPQKRMVWQGIDMSDPRKHWIQAKDPNTRMPIIGADGQPVWVLQPGFIGMKQTLHRSVLEFVREKGDPTHPEGGYVMKLKKRKRGREDREVEYSAMDGDHVALDAQLRPILGNLVNLRERFVTNAMPKRENLEAYCEAVRAKWGVRGRSMAQVPAAAAPAAEWLPHPQHPAYDYLPGTAQVRPRQPPLPVAPAVPVSPQPGVPPYTGPGTGPAQHPSMPSMQQLGAPPPPPAGPPSAPSAPAGAPLGPPTGAYPPPTAPGLSAPPAAAQAPLPPPVAPGATQEPPGPPPPPVALPGLPAAGEVPGAPPGPPPGPGMPDGHGATQGMSPAQLEAALAQKGTQAPF